MCDQAANTCFFVFDSVPNQYMTLEMCDRVVPFMLIHCPSRYKTQKMHDKTVDDYLVTLKFILDWFVTSKVLENFHDTLLTYSDILFFDVDFSKVAFFANKMGILCVDLDKINLNDNNFYKDDPETIIYVRLLAWHNKFKNHKALKKDINKELMFLEKHPKRWWDWWMSDMRKKK